MRKTAPKYLLETHVSVLKFAELKNTNPAQVYYHIEHGKIIPDYVGQKQTPMIDLKFYQDYVFPTRLKKPRAKAAPKKSKR